MGHTQPPPIGATPLSLSHARLRPRPVFRPRPHSRGHAPRRRWAVANVAVATRRCRRPVGWRAADGGRRRRAGEDGGGRRGGGGGGCGAALRRPRGGPRIGGAGRAGAHVRRRRPPPAPQYRRRPVSRQAPLGAARRQDEVRRAPRGAHHPRMAEAVHPVRGEPGDLPGAGGGAVPGGAERSAALSRSCGLSRRARAPLGAQRPASLPGPRLLRCAQLALIS